MLAIDKLGRVVRIRPPRFLLPPPRPIIHVLDVRPMMTVPAGTARVGGARAKRRFRGLNVRQGFEGIRSRGGCRGWFEFKAWYNDWEPIMVGENKQLTVQAENSNSAAKKVVTALKQADVIGVDDPDMYDFYMTSTAELDPVLGLNLEDDQERKVRRRTVPRRTRFYHYDGRFVSRPTTVVKRQNHRKPCGEEQKRNAGQNNVGKVYQVEGVAVVRAFDGERLSVPFTNINHVKDAVNKVLSGQTNIRSIQRQSMLNQAKSLGARRKFINRKLGNPPPPRLPN
jgi:hypothetical protein